MKTIPVVGADKWRLKSDLGRASLYAMYASSTGYITTDPMVMTVPVDDHLVHRGMACLNRLSVWREVSII